MEEWGKVLLSHESNFQAHSWKNKYQRNCTIENALFSIEYLQRILKNTSESEPCKSMEELKLPSLKNNKA